MTPFDRNEAIERFIGKCLGLTAYEFCSDLTHAMLAVEKCRNLRGSLAFGVRIMAGPLRLSPDRGPWCVYVSGYRFYDRTVRHVAFDGLAIAISEVLASALSQHDWPAFADDAEFQGLLEYMRETLK